MWEGGLYWCVSKEKYSGAREGSGEGKRGMRDVLGDFGGLRSCAMRSEVETHGAR